MALGAGGLAAAAGGVGIWRLLDGGATQWPWEQVWSKPLDGLYPAALNTHAGVLYLSGTGEVTAVDQATGGKRWQALSGLASQSAPAFGAGVVCINGVRTGGRTVVNGLEMASGRVLWERELDGLTQHAPTPAGDVMLVVVGQTSVASNTVLHALDTESGRTRWSTQLPARTSGPSAPVTGNGLLHLTSGVQDDGSMAWALDLATGTLRWKFPSEGFLGTPVLAGRELHITASPSNASADEGHNAFITLDAASGKVLRRAGNLPVGTESNIQRAGGTLYTAVRRYGDQYRSTLAAIDMSTGRVRWQSDTDIDLVRNPLLVSGDTALAGGNKFPELTGSYVVQVFDAATGHRRWSRDMGTQVSSKGPVLTGGTICVPTRATKYTEQGTLTFLDLASGASRWHRPLTANGDAMACPDGRTLYVLALPFPGPNGKTLDDQHGATLYALRRGNS
ncbi:PQQ-binding-like beta-propeller repeat protein [Streptomyces sp. W16]|uniref:PQQ-like beta-propeller repeat protein n=1 Tax=Streptomyces sp. W16 TaxID=3076631 RepID=UPI00295B1B2B|nr:PQQ-binding-like beta-propeller repeat protein [Streptomyces sp. W16]MDV9171133.1 PQQ-binding-like beta-propeller repeat protein [Streptomyces sp. W16]